MISMQEAKYSLEEKLAWVTRILSNEITPTQAAKLSGINDMSIIDWLRLYEVEGIQEIIAETTASVLMEMQFGNHSYQHISKSVMRHTQKTDQPF